MKHNQTVIAALLLASALCLTACGGESSAAPQSSASADVSVIETDAEPAESSEEESAAETDAPAPAEDNTVIDYGSLSIQVPGSFHIGSGEPGLYLGETEHNPKVVFLYCEEKYYKSKHEDETYTAADVPEIMKTKISSKLGSYYSSMDTDEYTVDAEEEVDVLGAKFILRKGSVLCAPGSSSEETLQFAGCYGVLDSQKSGQKDVPFAWIAYTEETSEEALTEIEEIIRNATKSAQFTS